MRDASDNTHCTESDVGLSANLHNIEDTTENQTPKKGRIWRRRNDPTNCHKNEGPVLRATVKPVKRFRPDSSPAGVSNPPTHQGPHVQSMLNGDSNLDKPKRLHQHHSPQTEQQNLKKKRVREQWSVEDKNHFFEAVALHGKDFEAIQRTIAQKHKKKGDDSAIKTKDQVRHLYYRTWTTVSKLLSEQVNSHHGSKALQELNAVINYGELWKRFGGYLLKKKEILKLTELINFGFTSIRIKGKTYRIKTPACKALKKIHDKEATKSNISESRRAKLPLRVVVDFYPLTMKAWHKVHLIGHNPRIRFNLPLSCNLSAVMAHLNKKWRSLSAKMFEVATLGHLQLENINFPTMHVPGSLEIHIPPDVAVKSKIEIHRIVTTKMNCVVSYAMEKLVKCKFSLSKKKINKPLPVSKVSQNDADTCNSSDEDDVQMPQVAYDLELPDHEIEPMYKWPILDDACLVSSNKECCNLEVPLKIQDQTSYCDATITTSSEPTKTFNSVHPTDTAASPTKFEPSPGVESTDSQSSSDSILASILPFQCSPTFEKDSAILQDKDKPPQCISKPTTAEPQIKLARMRITSPTDEPTTTKEQTATISKGTDEEVLTCITEKQPLIEAASDTETSSSISSCRFWNDENVGEVTLAEIYLMLGKPTHFKLCYNWIRQATEDATSNSATIRNKFSISTGIKALIQTASLLKEKLGEGISDSNQDTSGMCYEKPPQELKMNNVGIQCNISDKDKEIPFTPGPSTLSSTIKKSHSRGASRFSTIPVNSAETNFAVPHTPVRKRKLLQTGLGTERTAVDGSPNAEEIRQLVQERVDDVQFRRQMEALNRRMDLFRPQNRSRNRILRKPFVVQRTMMPNAGEVRKMMSLSIVSCGANKVGFVPQASVSTCVFPVHSTTTQACSSVTTSVTQSKAGDSLFGEAIGLKIQQLQRDKDAVPDDVNVLAAAAQQAGVDLPVSEKSTDKVVSSSLFSDFGKTLTPSNNEVKLDNVPTSLDDMPTRPITPSMDSLLESFNVDSNSGNEITLSPYADQILESRPLSMPPLDLQLGHPRSRPSSPVNSWLSSDMYPASQANFAQLNTPQRVVSDSEDSMDGLVFSPTKRPRSSYLGATSMSPPFLNDPDVDVHLQSLISENSVDLMAKFQDLIQQTTCDDRDSGTRVDTSNLRDNDSH